MPFATHPDPHARCPFCSRDGMVGFEREFTGSNAITAYKCHGCNRRWEAPYDPANPLSTKPSGTAVDPQSPAGSAPPADPNIAVVQQVYDAYRSRDLDRVFTLLSGDIEILQTDQLPWGGVYRGHAGAGAFFGRLAAHIEGTPEPQSFIAAGNDVVVIGRLAGRTRTTGRSFDIRIVHVVTMRDGRVGRFAAYIDTPAMLAVLA